VQDGLFGPSCITRFRTPSGTFTVTVAGTSAAEHVGNRPTRRVKALGTVTNSLIRTRVGSGDRLFFGH
jgi:hypothetical protein